MSDQNSCTLSSVEHGVLDRSRSVERMGYEGARLALDGSYVAAIVGEAEMSCAAVSL